MWRLIQQRKKDPQTQEETQDSMYKAEFLCEVCRRIFYVSTWMCWHAWMPALSLCVLCRRCVCVCVCSLHRRETAGKIRRWSVTRPEEGKIWTIHQRPHTQRAALRHYDTISDLQGLDTQRITQGPEGTVRTRATEKNDHRGDEKMKGATKGGTVSTERRK